MLVQRNSGPGTIKRGDNVWWQTTSQTDSMMSQAFINDYLLIYLFTERPYFPWTICLIYRCVFPRDFYGGETFTGYLPSHKVHWPRRSLPVPVVDSVDPTTPYLLLVAGPLPSEPYRCARETSHPYVEVFSVYRETSVPLHTPSCRPKLTETNFLGTSFETVVFRCRRIRGVDMLPQFQV